MAKAPTTRTGTKRRLPYWNEEKARGLLRAAAAKLSLPAFAEREGYLSYDGRYADLLFEVVTRRYDAQRPVLLSTNRPSPSGVIGDNYFCR